MSLKEKLLSDMKGAMKQRDTLRLNTIRSINSEIKNQEISLRETLGDEQIISLIASQIKKRKEAAALFEKGGRADLCEKEKQEVTILETYMPAQASEEDLRGRIKAIIGEVDAKGPADMGKVMKAVVPEFKGRADNALIKNIVNEILGRAS
jgi:uncharacterized protein YqeY